MKPSFNRLSRLSQIALSAATLTSAHAAPFIWTDTTALGIWSDAANWDLGVPPGDGTADISIQDIGNPGFTLTTKVDADWNTTGSGGIKSLVFNEGIYTLANGLATTNLSIGTGGFTNNSGNPATITFNSPVGGTITTAGSQTWALKAQNLTFRGNLVADSAADVLTFDTGTSNNKTILFDAAYTTTHAGTFYLKNTDGTLGNTLTFSTVRAGSFDRAAKLVIDNNDTLQNVTLNFNGTSGLNNSVASNLEFKNFVASTNNRAIIQTNMGGGLYGYAYNTLNFTGNLSGNLLGKTAGGSNQSVLNAANPGAYVLSGDNSGLTIDSNDVAHQKFLFSLRSGALVANSATALGINNALGVGIGDWNANVPTSNSGLYATPAAGTVNADVWTFTNNYLNGQIKSQPGYRMVGLLPTAANTESVTFNGNIYTESGGQERCWLRPVTGFINDASHGGTAIFNGAIQDFRVTNGGSSPLNLLTEAALGVVYHGSGSFQVNGVNTYYGKTVVRAGTVLLGSDAPSATPLILNNAVAASTGATTLTVTTIPAGLSVGQALANGVANVAPGTRITAIDSGTKQITLSLPTTGAIGVNVKLSAGGGALGSATSAVSLGDVVPSQITVDAATFGNIYPQKAGGNAAAWTAGDGVTTFTKFTFDNAAQAGILDGATLVTGNTVLVKDCNFDTNRNGVYVVDTAAKTWTRVSTLDESAEILANQGMRVHVTNGTQNANKDFYLLPVSSTASFIIDSVASTTVAGFAPQVFAADVTQPTVSLLTNGAYTVARDIDVTNNQSTGKSILGGNSAHASTFSGLVSLSRNLTLTAATGGTVDFTGDIVGSSDVTKEGPGKAVFSTAKTHSGVLNVAEGTLEVIGSISPSAINVTSGGTLEVNGTITPVGGISVASGGSLQGTGTISSTVTSAGTISPGSGGIGQLIAGATTLTGTLAVEIDGTNNDLLLVDSATLNLSGATLNVAPIGAGLTQPSYVIAESTSGLTGTFASVVGLPSGYAVTYNATQALLSQVSGSDYDTWAATYLPAIVTNPAADLDNDGLTNQQEYAFGLNPTLGSSANPITVPLNKTTGTFTYTRRKLSLVTPLAYTVKTSTDLSAWAPASISGESITTTGDIETVVVTLSGAPLGAPKLFVRVSAE
ncbi:MAG: hypothetical protein Q8Q59_07845 [Luteolibacter sp.]|nr:hypothetical protein [Luteolibacter sp.]